MAAWYRGDKAADEAQAAIAEAKATKAKAAKAERDAAAEAKRAEAEQIAEAKRAEAERIALAKRAEAERELPGPPAGPPPVSTKPVPEEIAEAKPNKGGFIALPFGLGFKYDKKAAGLENFRFARSKDEYWKNRPSWNKGPYSPEELAEYQAGCQARRLSAADGASDCSAH